MTKINTNLGSLLAKTYLSKAHTRSEKAATALASGKRINGAGDDAAGLAVSNKLASQIRGLETAFKNTSDGISLIQTAMAGMMTSLDISQRLRELAIQAQNGVYTPGDRVNMQSEVASLKQELGRVAEATKFNQINLLDGSYEQTMRVGNTNAEIVNLSIDGMGINKHIEGQSYAFGISTPLLSPLEYATGSSMFDTSQIETAKGEMAPVYKASATASGTSSFDSLASSQASTLSSSIYTQPITYAAGSSVFDTPLTSSATGSSVLDYLITNNATGTSAFSTPTISTAIGNSTLDIPATFAGTAVNSGDSTLLSRASGVSTRILKPETTASGNSQLNRLAVNQLEEGPVYTINGRTRSSGNSMTSGLIPVSTANVASGGDSTLRPISFVNSDFVGSPASRTIVNGEATQQINGWQIHLKQISLSAGAPAGLRRSIAGFSGPTDTNQPSGSSGDGTAISGFAGGNVELSYTLENNGITLGTNDVVSSPNGIVHGPYIVSDSAISLDAGDVISFNWQGVGSGDAADVYAFLIDENDGTIIELLNYTHNAIGQTPIFSVNETINRQGSYKFAFVSGSYDENGGGRVGSQVSLTNLAITQGNPANANFTNASVTVEAVEATSVRIEANSLTQLQNKVTQDLGNGVYSIVARGSDYTKFSIDQNGVITSTQPLLKATKSSYNFDVKYAGANGKTHVETVTLNLQAGLGAISNFTAQEADIITINRQELDLLDGFYNTAGGGSFRIANRADGAKFMIGNTGNIISNMPINAEDGSLIEFDVIYTAPDGRNFINQVRLTILDTLESTGIFTAEEGDEVNINASDITSSAAFAAADGLAGSFQLSGTDATKFRLDGAGNIISRGPLRLADQQTYYLNYSYRSSGGPVHIENITLRLTEALQATSTLFANEADVVRITRSQMENLNEYAARDNYAGSYGLAANSIDGDDYLLFNIDANGTVTSRNRLDPSVQNQYTFDVTYTDSNGEIFRETVNLTLSPPSSPVTTIQATETPNLTIAASEFQYTVAQAAATPGGTYSLSGGHSGLFTIDVNGNISANQSMMINRTNIYNPTDTYNFMINYTQGGVIQSSENVRLRIREAIEATANFSVHESSSQIIINAEDLFSIDSFARRDRKSGNYSLGSVSGDHAFFTVDGAGRITSNAGLEFDSQQSYNFTLTYQSANGDSFTETIILNLTDTFSSTASLQAEETQSLAIDNTTLSSSFAFYSKDPGVGSFQLTGSDAAQFTIDGVGNITSTGPLLRSAQARYNFTVQYTASNGDTHNEAVTLEMTEALQGTSSLIAIEAGNVQILLDRLTNLSGFASRDGSRGSFSIEAAGPDYNKFTIAPNGNLSSIGALDFDTQQSYNFTVSYLASDGRRFRDAVTLSLIDTLNSTANLSTEESTQVVITAPTLSATSTYVAKDPGIGNYTLSGADAGFFNIAAGEVRANQPLVYNTKQVYNFTVEYTDSLGSVHSEAVTLNLTPSYQSDTILEADESGRIEMRQNIFTQLDIFAAADGYAGSYRLERYDNDDGNPANDGDADDFNQFALNADGSVHAKTALDFSVEETFHFNLIYRASNGQEFTDRVVLNLKDTLRSSASMQVEEADQMVINIADLTASSTYAARNPGGNFSIGAGNNLFSVQGNQIIANKDFRKEEQNVYNFELNYRHGGVQHVETVQVDLTRFLQSQGSFVADEAETVLLSAAEFEHMFDFANDNTSGAYALAGRDAGLFRINDSGDVISRSSLDYDSQQDYELNLTYTAGDGRVFTSQIDLRIRDTFTATSRLLVEEAQRVVIDGALLTSLQTYAAKDGNQGQFVLLQQGDHDKFALASDGTLTSHGELRMAENPVLNAFIRYEAAGMDDFTEQVNITLTPTSYDHSRSHFTAKEAGEVIIIPQLNPHLQAYAAADNYAGRFEITQSPYATAIDQAFFEIDGTGQLKTTQKVDFEEGKTNFEITVLYHHSSNTRRYTDFLNLNIINDKRDDNNLALDDINLSTREGAAEATQLLNEVILRITSAQAKLGAIENRFTHNLDNLSMSILMSEQANGRIIDADYALESTHLARSQILERAATDMLTKANYARQNLVILIG